MSDAAEPEPCVFCSFRRSHTTKCPVGQNKRLRELLREAALQITYLHEKFRETGSGNAVIARIESELAR